MQRNKVKVFHVGKFYHPIQGGIEKQLQLISEGLIKKGHKVRCFVASQDQCAKTDRVNGVFVYRRPSFGKLFSHPITSWPLSTWAKLLKKKWMVHVHAPHPLVTFLFLFFRGKKLITVHAFVKKNKIVDFLYYHFLIFCLKRYDKVIVSSPVMKEKLPSVIAKKTEVIPFGVEDQFKKFINKEEEPKVTLGDIIFIGRLVSYKGLLEFLPELKTFSGRFLLVGNGPLKKQLEQKALDLGIEEKVVFLGELKGQEKWQWLSQSQVAVLPSQTEAEAFGIFQVEAMMLSKPVVSYALNTGVRWVNRNGLSGYVVEPVGRGDLFMEAVKKIVLSKSIFEELSLGARQNYLDRFQLETMIFNYEFIYQKLLEREV